MVGTHLVGALTLLTPSALLLPVPLISQTADLRNGTVPLTPVFIYLFPTFTVIASPFALLFVIWQPGKIKASVVPVCPCPNTQTTSTKSPNLRDVMAVPPVVNGISSSAVGLALRMCKLLSCCHQSSQSLCGPPARTTSITSSKLCPCTVPSMYLGNTERQV